MSSTGYEHVKTWRLKQFICKNWSLTLLRLKKVLHRITAHVMKVPNNYTTCMFLLKWPLLCRVSAGQAGSRRSEVSRLLLEQVVMISRLVPHSEPHSGSCIMHRACKAPQTGGKLSYRYIYETEQETAPARGPGKGSRKCCEWPPGHYSIPDPADG